MFKLHNFLYLLNSIFKTEQIALNFSSTTIKIYLPTQRQKTYMNINVRDYNELQFFLNLILCNQFNSY